MLIFQYIAVKSTHFFASKTPDFDFLPFKPPHAPVARVLFLRNTFIAIRILNALQAIL